LRRAAGHRLPICRHAHRRDVRTSGDGIGDALLVGSALAPLGGVRTLAPMRRKSARPAAARKAAARPARTARGATRKPVGAVMKAVAIDRFGPPSVLGVRELARPKCGPDEVLIALHTAGVGVWDARMRDGTWAEGRPRFPLVLGTDGAGVVVDRGARVRRFHVGDLVYAYRYQNPKGGFYAQLVAVDSDHVAHVPPHLDVREAGAASVTGLTALQGIDDALEVKQGDTVLVFGASGAVGTLALQFAKRRGARGLAAASGRDGMALVRGLGADVAFDARGKGIARRLRTLAPDGIDAVLALAGGDALEACLDHVRAGGRIAYPNGVEPEPRKRPKISVVGYDGAVGRRELARLERAVVEAHLRVPIAERFSLDKAAKAHARLQRGHVLGRIVLDVDQEPLPPHPGNA
jgi:NADPH:quinone reductase